MQLKGGLKSVLFYRVGMTGSVTWLRCGNIRPAPAGGCCVSNNRTCISPLCPQSVSASSMKCCVMHECPQRGLRLQHLNTHANGGLGPVADLTIEANGCLHCGTNQRIVFRTSLTQHRYALAAFLSLRWTSCRRCRH